MATNYELSFSDYLSIVRRRIPYLVGIFVLVLLITIVVAFSITPIYRSSGTIMVESQPVSENIVPSTIKMQLDERINVINQRVMTRDNLLRIADKYDLFKESMGSLTTSEMIEKLKDRILIEPVSSNEGYSRQGQPTVAFTISFEDRQPDVALQVTNDLVKLFLDWNVRLRTEGAEETTTFLTQESERLKNEVDRLETQISSFKQMHQEALPEQLTLRMSMMARAENDLREVERDYRSTKEELRSLEVELAAAKRGIGSENTTQTLPALKAEYTRLSAIYTDAHPDIKAIKRKIDALEHISSSPESAITSTGSLSVYRIQAKIDSDNARLSSLAQQRNMLQAKISENERAMIQTPKVEQGLDVLIRDRDSAQRKYEEIRSKKMNAQIAQNLESENKSERFSLLEPPLLPEKPFKPNRLKILLMGIFLAIFSAGGVVMVLETIDNRIRGTEALTHVLGHRPLVVIPYIPVIEEFEHQQLVLKMSAIAGAASFLAAAIAIHFLYMPLNILFAKLLARLM